MASLSYTIGLEIVDLRKDLLASDDYAGAQVLHNFEDKVDGFSKAHKPVMEYLTLLLDYCEFCKARAENDEEIFAWDLSLEIVNRYMDKATEAQSR